jgi:hypothetical protein
VFSGNEILAQALQVKLEAVGIEVTTKNNVQSGRIAGFGTADQALEIFIQETNFAKANPVIEDFRMSI